MRALFECVAMAIKNKGVRGLCELVPGGQYLLDVCSEAFKLLRERQRDRKLREELAQVAAASAEEARKTAEEVARQVVGEEMSEEKVALELYLAQIPGAVRASLKRSDDPTGRTVPPGLAINTPGDLARLLPQRAPQFRPGADLPGRSGWQLEELLGAGGFGEVWMVRHSFIPQARAVKFCTDPHLRTRLTSHEGKVIARVMGHRNHPNVVPLLDAVLDGETPWLMYEYVGGGDLAELIHEWQQFTPSERESLAVDALHQLAAAVGTFHRLAPPIVHRDLKPANILVELGSSGDSGHSVVLRITDFGIGGVVVDALHAGQPAGTVMATGVLETSLRGSYTPLYASPQQRAGNPPDPRDDVHALGVIGFHMMTGRLTEAPGIDAVDDLRESGVSDALTAMIAKCVASKAERRPKDAGELAEQLRGLSKSSSVPRSKPATDQPVTTKPQRSREAGDRPIQSSLFQVERQRELFSPAGTVNEPGVQSTPAPTRCIVPLRGLWFARAADVPDTAWPETGKKLPTEVVANPGEVYCLKLNPDTTTDAEVAKLRSLAGFPGLQAIDLTACKLLTDAGLLHLVHLGGLRAVSLTDTLVTDAGLTALFARLPGLERIGLAGAVNITRAVIPDLMRLRNLNHLTLPPRWDIVDVRVELARRRPACRVV